MSSMPSSYFVLVDCNNFYASCERLFRPDLANKPIVVLSNNDGCIIARSNEAKDLGIPMGAPYYQYAKRMQQEGVAVFSSNFALYGDLSERVMSVLEMHTDKLERYSIDEAFFKLDKPDIEFCHYLRSCILKWTGISVSIGLGASKTLAKLSNHYAKKNPETRGVALYNPSYLKETMIEDVWGIGKKLTEFLKKYNIQTAEIFLRCKDIWVKKHMKSTGLRILWELRGKPCLALDTHPSSKQSITCAKSFPKELESFSDIAAALADYTQIVAKKLRDQNSFAHSLSILLHTNYYKTDAKQYHKQILYPLSEGSNHSNTLITHAKMALKSIYKQGYSYKKVGITALNLHGMEQLSLFTETDEKKKFQKVMQCMDEINDKYGKNTLHFAAAEAVKRESTMRSPRYTSSWDELALIKLNTKNNGQGHVENHGL